MPQATRRSVRRRIPAVCRALAVSPRPSIGAWTRWSDYQRSGARTPGFAVMENLLVGVGDRRAGRPPADGLVRAMNGQILGSGRDLQAEVARHPAGTTFTTSSTGRGQLVEVRGHDPAVTVHDFHRFLRDGLLPGAPGPGSGRPGLLAQAGVPERAFLAFALLLPTWSSATYSDAHTTYRFFNLFVTAWAFWPATFIHLALTFPQRRTVVLRLSPRGLGCPTSCRPGWPASSSSASTRSTRCGSALVPSVGAAYWGVALILLVLALARTSLAGRHPLMPPAGPDPGPGLRRRLRPAGAGHRGGGRVPRRRCPT